VKNKSLQAACILLLCFTCLRVLGQEKAVVPSSAPYAGATVSDFKGKVSIQLPGQAVLAPTRGALLPPDSIVNTEDGRLLLHLSDGSDILVQSHTRLVLKQPESNSWHYLQLILGKIHSQIQHRLGGTPAFQLGTPSAVISVRGTVFDVEVDTRGNTELDVEEGRVELSSKEGRGESVMVTAGFSSRVGTDSSPETPRPTHDLRPQLDRRGHRDRGPGGNEDEAIRRLQASTRDSREGGTSGTGGSGSSGTSGGSDDGMSSNSGSTSGSNSGPGSSSGSDGGSSGSAGSSGSDDGDRRRGGKGPGLI
jgi:FecR protein